MVAPKKEKLAAAEAEYSELMVGLNQKKAELAAVEANLAALNTKLKEMQDQKQQVLPTITQLFWSSACRLLAPCDTALQVLHCLDVLLL